MIPREVLRMVHEAGGGGGRRALRIMIVEDEGLVALQTEAFLEEAGHLVLGIAADRASALQLARTASPPPDLALVDVRLANGARGTDVAFDLADRGIPVLFVTGNRPADGKGGSALGCLHKPFSQGELIASVAVAQAMMQGLASPPIPPALHLY